MSVETSVIWGEGGKGGHTPTEARDTLQSNNVAHILDLISEGEIEGVQGGAKGVYFNEVPLQNADGSYNFSGASVLLNYGKVDQPALPGFDATLTSVSVQQDLPYNVNKTISFPNDFTVTAVLIQISLSQFFKVESDGDVVGTSVTFVIERSQNGGAFVNVMTATITGKQSQDEVTFDYRVPVTDPSGNTAIRVRRTTPDPTDLKTNDAIAFKLYTKVVEHKLTYANTALAGTVIDAKQFGNQLPSRAFKVRGIKAKVPNNYTAATRKYTGAFNGTLTATKVWTNNPAWVFYELVSNKRFGLGKFVDSSLVDIPSLYQVAKWCDGFEARFPVGTPGKTDDYHPTTGCHGVPDGRGGFEPRWVCNAVINNRGDAFNVLRELVSCFRGNLFWMEAKLWALADQTRTPVKIVTNANVIDGAFTYSGESNRRRYSVVNVAFNDPDLFYRRGIEVVEDPALIRELGYKPKDHGAFGCTSRSQARRVGRAVLFSQEYESDIVSYKAAFDHMAVDGTDGPTGIAPGDLILIADRHRGNALAAGRALGPVSGDFVTNGTFDVDTTGWTKRNSTNTLLSIVNGRLRVASGSASLEYAYQAVPVTVGSTYTFKVTGYTGTREAKVSVGTTAGGAQLVPLTILTNGVETTFTFTAATATAYITLLQPGAVVGDYAEFDNVSLVGEVQNSVGLDRDTGSAGSGTIYIEHAATGKVETLTCTYNANNLVTLTQNPVQPVAANDLYILTANTSTAEPYIVLKLAESEQHMFEVTAVRWDEDRFNAIYNDIHVDTDDIMSLANPRVCQPAVGPLVFTDRYITSTDVQVRVLDVRWQKSPDPYLSHYVLSYRKDNGPWRTLPDLTGLTATINSVGPGTYEVRVVAVNRAQVNSLALAGSTTLAAVPSTDALPTGTVTPPTAEPPTGGPGGWTGGGSSTTGTGRDIRVRWGTATSPVTNFLTDSGVSAGTGLVDRFFREFKVTVKNPSTNAVLRTEAVTDNFYTYTYEKNREDTNNVPLSSVKFEVQYRDVFGRLGTAQTLTVDNVPPGVPTGVSASAGPLSNRIAWTNPLDADFAYAEVLANTTNNSGTASVIARTSSTSTIHSGLTAGQDYYYWVRAVDAFGNMSSLSAVVGPITAASVQAYDAAIAQALDDDVLDPTEKAGVLAQVYADIEARYQTLLARAPSASVSTVAMTAARTNWRDLLALWGKEFVPNGTFVNNTSGWTAGNGATLSAVSGRMRITSAGGQFGPDAFQQINGLIVGQQYTVSCSLFAGTAGSQQFRVGTTGAGSQYGFSTAANPSITFTATQTSVFLTAIINATPAAGLYIEITNISLKESPANYAWNDTSQPTKVYTHLFADQQFPTNWTDGLARGVTTAPNGVYTTVIDNSASQFQFIMRSQSQTAFATQYSTGVVVKKDAIPKTTRFGALRLNFTGGTVKNVDVSFDTSTGEVGNIIGNADAFGCLDLGDDWLFWVTATSNANNTGVEVNLFPAVGGSSSLVSYSASVSGSIDVRGTPLIYYGDWKELGRAAIVGRLNAFIAAQQAVSKAISEYDATVANWGTVNSRPGNLSSLTGSEGILNTLLSIGSNGALSGGGGGQVTFGGLGGGALGLRASLAWNDALFTGRPGNLAALAGSEDIRNSLVATNAQSTRALFFNQSFDLVAPDSSPPRPQGLRATNSSTANMTDTALGYVGGVTGGDLAVGIGTTQLTCCYTPMWRVNRRSTYRVRGKVKGAAAATGFYCRFHEYDGEPASSVTHLISNGVVPAEATLAAATRQRSSGTAALTGGSSIENAAVTTAYQDFNIEIQPTSTATYMSVSLLKNWATAGGELHISELVIEEITPTSVLQFDYTGDLAATVGAAWGSNLTGRPSNLSSLTGSEGILNSGITIGANGALGGGGGGQVTIGGLTPNGLDNIADGTTYARLPAANTTGTGTSRRALIDFTQGHSNKSLANVDSAASTKLGGIAAGATVGADLSTNVTNNTPNYHPPIMGAGLRYKVTGAPTYGSTTSTQATITHSGSVIVGSRTYTYSSSSVVVTGSGTQTFYVYVTTNPFSSGTHTLLATTNTNTPYQDDNSVYIGSVTITFTSGGTGSGDTGGGTACVWEDAFVHTMRGWVPASEVQPGDILRVLSDDRTGLRWEPVTKVTEGEEESFTITGVETGIEVTVSQSTPITLRDGAIIRPADIDHHELPFEAGDRLWWEPCIVRGAGIRRVMHIYCNQKTYSAGNAIGRGILTHNPKP